jgi:hypothetical protein
VDPTIPEKRPKTNISKFKVLFYPKEKVEVLNDIIQSLNESITQWRILQICRTKEDLM